MSLDQELLAQVTRLLEAASDEDQSGPRLGPEAQRLWERIRCFMRMGLGGRQLDKPSLELCCYALQLPRSGSPGKARTRPNLRQRCEQAAEMFVSLLGDQMDEKILDRVSRLLLETPQRSPMLDEARLLADAVNLDDFGIVGLLALAGQLAIAGASVADVALALKKREAYGYWEARLKDGFHFEPVARLARRRLEEARKVGALLQAELAEDRLDEKT